MVHTFISTKAAVSSMATRSTGTTIAKGLCTSGHLSVVSGSKSTREPTVMKSTDEQLGEGKWCWMMCQDHDSAWTCHVSPNSGLTMTHYGLDGWMQVMKTKDLNFLNFERSKGSPYPFTGYYGCTHNPKWFTNFPRITESDPLTPWSVHGWCSCAGARRQGSPARTALPVWTPPGCPASP